MVRIYPRPFICQGRVVASTVIAIAIALTATLALAAGMPARAEEPESQPAAMPDPYHELETKYLFGFTTGSDIGEEGEKSVEFETTAALGKRGGSRRARDHYTASPDFVLLGWMFRCPVGRRNVGRDIFGHHISRCR